MNPSVPFEKPSEESTVGEFNYDPIMSDIAKQILEIGEKVWAEVKAKHGKVNPIHHKEIERRIDASLKEKFPGKEWHPNFAGMIGGYTETFVIQAIRK